VGLRATAAANPALGSAENVSMKAICPRGMSIKYGGRDEACPLSTGPRAPSAYPRGPRGARGAGRASPRQAPRTTPMWAWVSWTTPATCHSRSSRRNAWGGGRVRVQWREREGAGAVEVGQETHRTLPHQERRARQDALPARPAEDAQPPAARAALLEARHLPHHHAAPAPVASLPAAAAAGRARGRGALEPLSARGRGVGAIEGRALEPLRGGRGPCSRGRRGTLRRSRRPPRRRRRPRAGRGARAARGAPRVCPRPRASAAPCAGPSARPAPSGGARGAGRRAEAPGSCAGARGEEQGARGGGPGFRVRTRCPVS
jgi:hypothetical protein